MAKVSTSEFDSNYNASEYSCRSKVTMVLVPVDSKQFISWTSVMELSKLFHSDGLPEIIGKLLKIVVGFFFCDQ